MNNIIKLCQFCKSEINGLTIVDNKTNEEFHSECFDFITHINNKYRKDIQQFIPKSVKKYNSK
jgi:hypothetical protein